MANWYDDIPEYTPEQNWYDDIPEYTPEQDVKQELEVPQEDTTLPKFELTESGKNVVSKFSDFVDLFRRTKPGEPVSNPIEDIGGTYINTVREGFDYASEGIRSGVEAVKKIGTETTEEKPTYTSKTKAFLSGAYAPFKPLAETALGAGQVIAAPAYAFFSGLTLPAERATGIPAGVLDLLAPASLLGKAKKATTIEKAPFDGTASSILGEVKGIPQEQLDSLAAIHIGARNPFTRTEKQINELKLLQDTSADLRSARAESIRAQISMIDDDIARVAADTSLSGAKEELTKLNNKKQELTAKLDAPESTVINTKLTSSQIEDNLAYPVTEALDNGVPLATAETALRESLPIGLPKYDEKDINSIVEEVLRPYKEASPILAPTPELALLTATDAITVENVVKKAASKAKEFIPVNEKELDGALKSNVTNVSLKFNNDLAPFYAISRLFSKKNGDVFGSQDNLIADLNLATIKNTRFQTNNSVIPSLIGAPDGSTKYIQKANNLGIVEDVYDIKPFTAIYEEAKANGLTVEQLKEFRLAANALDDYMVIDNKVKELNETLSKLKTERLSVTDPVQIAKIDDSIKEVSAEIADTTRQTTYTQYLDKDGKLVDLPRQRAEEVFNELSTTPAGKQFLDDMQKWSNHLLNIRKEAGLISAEEVENLKRTHKYYLSASRYIDDYGFDDLRQFVSSGTVNKALNKRGISDTTYTADDVDNTLANMISAVRASQANKERQLMMQFFVERLDDSAWKKIFREEKSDVIKAITRAKIDPDAPRLIEAGSITKADPLQQTGNFSVFYNGRKVELTVVDKNMFTSMTRPKVYNRGTDVKWIDTGRSAMIHLAQLNRNLITTYNPVFNVKSFVREAVGYAYTADQKVIGRANLYKFWKSADAVRKMASDKELYHYMKSNISPGVTQREFKDLRGDNLVESVSKSKAIYDNKGALAKLSDYAKNNKIVSSLEEFAQVSDLSSRSRYYEDTKKALLAKGHTPQEAEAMAISAARDLGVNYQERGASSVFSLLQATTPFMKTTINSLGKDIATLRYKKQQVAEVTSVLTAVSLAVNEYNKQFVDENGVPTVLNLDENVRTSGWALKTGTGVNDYVIIPAPFAPAGRLAILGGDAITTSLMKASGELADRYDKSIDAYLSVEPSSVLTKNDYIALAVNTLSGNISYSTFTPIFARVPLELMQNKDWRGTEIEPSFLQSYEPSERFLPGQTSKGAIELGKVFNTSPTKIQYAVEASLGILGQGIMTTSDMLVSASQGLERPQFEKAAIPGVATFSGYGSEVDRTGSSEKYSRIREPLQQVAKTLERKKSNYEKGIGSKEEYYQYMEDNKNLIRAYKTIIEPADTSLKNLYKKLTKLQYGGYPSSTTPEKELLGDPKLRDEITKTRNEINKIKENALRDIYINKEDYGDLWDKRIRLNPAVDTILSPFKSLKPQEKEQKPVDKSKETSYNFLDNFSLISSAEASELGDSLNEDTTQGIDTMLPDIPDGYQFDTTQMVQEQQVNSDEPYAPDFFENYLPNIRSKIVSVNKSKIVDKVLTLEGGYVNNPRDNGGPTKYGVTLSTLKKVRPGATINDVKNLTVEEAKGIYTNLFWDKAKVDNFPIKLQDIIFDGNINHGTTGMTKVVQRALNDLGAGLKVDGVLGNKTLNAVKKYPVEEVRAAIYNRRKRLYEQHEDADVFGKGWLDRLSKYKTTPDIKEA